MKWQKSWIIIGPVQMQTLQVSILSDTSEKNLIMSHTNIVGSTSSSNPLKSINLVLYFLNQKQNCAAITMLRHYGAMLISAIIYF